MPLLSNSPDIKCLGSPGGSDGKASACNVGDPALIPELGRSPGEGNGNPLQYSCLENPMNGGAWQVTVHGVPKSRTWLSDFTFTFFHAPGTCLGRFWQPPCNCRLPSAWNASPPDLKVPFHPSLTIRCHLIQTLLCPPSSRCSVNPDSAFLQRSSVLLTLDICVVNPLMKAQNLILFFLCCVFYDGNSTQISGSIHCVFVWLPVLWCSTYILSFNPYKIMDEVMIIIISG